MKDSEVSGEFVELSGSLADPLTGERRQVLGYKVDVSKVRSWGVCDALVWPDVCAYTREDEGVYVIQGSNYPLILEHSIALGAGIP